VTAPEKEERVGTRKRGKPGLKIFAGSMAWKRK